jgi:hypothetical protein
MSAYLLLRGMKTLDLRIQRQNESALRIARFLESHPAVERVFYPGLDSHAGHLIARQQMRLFGGVLSFLLKDNSLGAVGGLSLDSVLPMRPGIWERWKRSWPRRRPAVTWNVRRRNAPAWETLKG